GSARCASLKKSAASSNSKLWSAFTPSTNAVCAAGAPELGKRMVPRPPEAGARGGAAAEGSAQSSAAAAKSDGERLVFEACREKWSTASRILARAGRVGTCEREAVVLARRRRTAQTSFRLGDR